MIAGLLQVRRAVSPLNQLRSRLAAVHSGEERGIGGRYPAEVQPLVDDLNALIEHREAAVRRAILKAGDLAHGLKTPLAILSQEADRARQAGHEEFAGTLSEQVSRMRRQIEYHLAHARAAASGAVSGASTPVGESVQALARTLRRLYAERRIEITSRVPPDHTVRVQREDLDEMLGNLMENAAKWTRSAVTVSSARENGWILISVDDDGPGVPPQKREIVLQRGVRMDEAAPGTGFGLAIVRDLSELYGGTIALHDAPAGGLRATLRLPAAATASA
jgi:signal transduction histidine kinase